MPRKTENYTWGEILDCFKKGIFGPEEDFDDDDFEEVKEAEEPQLTEQADKKTREPVKSAQESVSKPAHQEVGKDSSSVLCSALQSDLNTFVQTGTVSDPLLQLLKEGFDKNPDLLEEIAKYIAVRRRGSIRATSFPIRGSVQCSSRRKKPWIIFSATLVLQSGRQFLPLS